MDFLFAADIGATNSRFALFRLERDGRGGASLALEKENWLASGDYPSFAGALRALLAGEEPFFPPGAAPPAAAVLALAGPVRGGSCRVSNLPWLVRSREAAEILGIARVLLINDFVAQGLACLLPEFIETSVIQAGNPVSDSPAAVIGAGTGLGKALILPPSAASVRLPAPCGTSRCLPAPALRLAAGARILPSEGGHAEFPFLDGEEENFAAWLRRETGRRRLIGDMVVSGSGLGHLFAFSSGRRLPDAQASGAALDRPDILDSFARFYARACRDFVLETLALRGLFITGGLALRLPVLNRPAFLAEFRDSAAHSRLLEQVPIRQVLEPSAGIWGAALLGALREEPGAVRE